jgi:proteic killer suppression protein
LTLVTQNVTIIKLFGNKETEKIYLGIASKRYPPDIQQIARRKLKMLHASQNLKDLRIPPANRLEKLKGNLSSYHSIRVNQQWRIIFNWYENDTLEVQLVDYH